MAAKRLKLHCIAFYACICLLNACSTVPPKHINSNNWVQATSQVFSQYAPTAESNLVPYFNRAHVAYPPKKIALLTFKQEQKLELWAKDRGNWAYIRNYSLTANSGRLGPKLHEADRQIPEGIYRIVHLNPFSAYHLSLMLNYPNEFDKRQARIDGRKKLGDNIFIHGKNLSAGCIAIGDKAINQLFVLVGRVGKHNTQVIIAPKDLRYKKAIVNKRQPRWLAVLYRRIGNQLSKFTPRTAQV